MGEDQLDDLELDGPITLRILDGNSLGLHASEMMEVMEDREVWRLNLELLPSQPSRKAGNEERRRKRRRGTYNMIYVSEVLKNQKGNRNFYAKISHSRVVASRYHGR